MAGGVPARAARWDFVASRNTIARLGMWVRVKLAGAAQPISRRGMCPGVGVCKTRRRSATHFHGRGCLRVWVCVKLASAGQPIVRSDLPAA